MFRRFQLEMPQYSLMADTRGIYSLVSREKKQFNHIFEVITSFLVQKK